MVSKAIRFCDGQVVCNLEHNRRVAEPCMFYNICVNPVQGDALAAVSPRILVPVMMTRQVFSDHFLYLDVPRFSTVQLLGRLLLALCAHYYNSLDEPCFVPAFKSQINSTLLFC